MRFPNKAARQDYLLKKELGGGGSEVDWENVNGRPSKLSEFDNDEGYITEDNSKVQQGVTAYSELDKKIDKSPEEGGPVIEWKDLGNNNYFFGMEDKGGLLSGFVAMQGTTTIALEGQANQYIQLTPHAISFTTPSLDRVATIGSAGALNLVEGNPYNGTYLPFRYGNPLELSQINDPNHIPNKEYVDNAVADKADKDELFSGDYNDLTNKPTSDIQLGVTAHGWGNHAEAGYLKSIPKGVAVEDATSEEEVLTQLNALLNSLRGAGLIED